MRSRLPLILIALTMLVAFGAAGCGDKKSSEVESVPDLATPTPAQGSTGSSGAASGSAQLTLNNCLKAADAAADASTAKDLKKKCREAYDNIKESSAKIDQATSDARAQCEEAAGKIGNADAKSAALAACAKFK